MSGRRALVGGVMTLALAGCKLVGPDYHGPPPHAVFRAPQAQAPFLSASGGEFAPQAPPGEWWRLFNEPQLDALEHEALSVNTDLRAARANLERSAALLNEARAARQPSVTLSLDPSYQQISAASYLYPGFLGPRGLYDAGIAVSYDLDLFGRLRRGVEAAQADAEGVKAAYDLAQVNVAAETARAYAEVCTSGEELAVAHRSLDLQDRSTDVTARLVEAGRAPQLDETRSAVLLSQLRATIPELEARRMNALFRLAALTGHVPAAYPHALEACREAPHLMKPLPTGDGAALLRRRPDIREAERRLAAATARIGVATADLYPQATIGLSVGSTGGMTSALDRHTNRYALGLGIHWQANTSAARARIAAADAQAQLALAQFDGVVLAALRDTETALTDYARELDRDESLGAAAQHAREVENEAQALYQNGKIDFLPLLDAERTRIEADQAVAASHAAVAFDQVTIFLTLGGGWQ